MSHTPGPWSVSKRATLRVIAHDDNTIASTGCTDNLRDQWEANAHLISAAPDLLAALEDVVDALECRRNVGMMYTELCEVIAKAKGEA